MITALELRRLLCYFLGGRVDGVEAEIGAKEKKKETALEFSDQLLSILSDPADGLEVRAKRRRRLQLLIYYNPGKIFFPPCWKLCCNLDVTCG